MTIPAPDLHEELLKEQDKFAYVLSNPPLQNLSPDAEKMGGILESLSTRLACQDDRHAVELAIIWITRRYIDLHRRSPLKRVATIERGVERMPIMLRAQMTRGALLRSMGYHEHARIIFESCMKKARPSNDHFAFALSSVGYADACLFLGRHSDAEEAYVSAIATFRRYQNELWAAAAMNNFGVLKKRMGEYRASLRLVLEARRIHERLGNAVGVFDATKNVGIVAQHLGDWKVSRRWFEDAQAICSTLKISSNTEVSWGMATPLDYLDVLQRRFGLAERTLLRKQTIEDNNVRAHVHQTLADLYAETGEYKKSTEQVESATGIASSMFPEGELMAGIMRRRAQVLLYEGKLHEAITWATRCVKLANRIESRGEMGAALRIFAEARAAEHNDPAAAACFRAAVHTLKSIHECYELMRTLYAQGRFLATTGKQDEAEIALLEARQLSKKLELEYYQALIAIAMADTLGPQERFEEAQTWIAEAIGLRDQLEGVDRERVDTALKRSANDLQKLITCASVKSAETLKTICRVYEDARFPFEDMRADLAYQVAQSINAESLFVVGKAGTGYRVPITYNISTNESKEIVRRLERILHSKTFLNVKDEPQILTTLDRRTLLAVPCRESGGNVKTRRSSARFVACARFEADFAPGARQIELMCASAEALARIIEEDELRPARKPASASAEVDDEALETRRPTHPRGSFKSILTINPEMIKLIRTAERAATSVAPILLEGETGVGKELFARAIHGASQRKDGPFVAINAGGMSVHLLESELFGHVKGAFTDAGSDRTGLVDTARGGTLFFDEVGEMGEEMQVKLLRLMENGEYRRLGESTMRRADVRVISATNRDLKRDAERGLFRRDLYYRLSPLKLTIPPLRLRVCDIQLMTRYFLRECAAMNGIADRYIEIDVKAMEALELYDWPGNVRELHNEILRVVSLIGRGDLVRFTMLSDGIKEFLKTKKRGDGLLDRSVEQYERRLILDALERHDWNKLRTADAIGIPRTTLLAKLKRMNVASKV